MTSDKAGERDTVARRIHLDLHLSAPSPPVALEPPAMSSPEPQTEPEGQRFHLAWPSRA